MSHSRRMTLAGLLGSAVGAACVVPGVGQAERSLWFDPSQLPSFSGRLERWIMNPAGETDRGMLREGSQFVFSPAEAEGLKAAAGRGDPLTIWGIRARGGPVITVLAWARREDEPPQFLERPGWFASTARGRDPLSVEGKVQAPLLTPQGEPMGVLLDNGGVVRLDPAVHRALGDRLSPGTSLAATGLGTRRGDAIALDAERIGRTTDTLTPLPDPPK